MLTNVIQSFITKKSTRQAGYCVPREQESFARNYKKDGGWPSGDFFQK